MTRTVSPIWNFFEKLEYDRSRALCKQCGRTLSLGSDKPRLQSCAGLKGHLRGHHKEEFQAFLKRSSERELERLAKRIKQEHTETVKNPAYPFELPTFSESVMKPEYVMNSFDSWAKTDIQNGDTTGASSQLIVIVLYIAKLDYIRAFND